MHLLCKKKIKLGITSRDMLGMPRKHCMELAEQLIAGTLVFDYTLPETYSYQSNRIPWKIDASPSARLYLQGLAPVSFLVGAYVLNPQKSAYFELARMFVESWISFAPPVTAPKLNCYNWDQHAVALRTETLLYYLLVGTEEGLISASERRRVERVLFQHGNYLADPKLYLNNENHGVFQDRALLYLSYAFGNREWTDLARKRALCQWNFLFGESGACVENSYAYQHLDKELFWEIVHLLILKNDTTAQALCSRIAKAEHFMGFALVPDEHAPAYGDSFRTNFHKVKTFDPTGPLAYATGNPEAPIPEDKSVIYPKEGYYFGREFWALKDDDKQLKPRDAVWVMLKSGYRSITHRHADDNAFMLYARGHEIFTDAGFYSNQYKDPIRQYIRSANAHNTVIVDECSYDFLRKDLKEQAGIVHYEINSGCGPDYIVTFSKLYCGVIHIRHFLYWGTDILLVDELSSINEHRYSQLFHCGPRICVEKAGEIGALLRIGDEPYGLSLRQMQFCDSFVCHYGNEKGILYGNVSEAANQLTKTHTLQYTRQGKTACFVTHLSLTDQNGNSLSGICPELDVSHMDLSVFCTGQQTQIKLYRAKADMLGMRFAFPMDRIQVEVIGNRIVFTNTAHYPCTVSYAWYLLAKNRKTVLLQVRYNPSPCFELVLDQELCRKDAIYFVRGFVFAKRQKKKASQMVAKIQIQAGKPIVQMIFDYDSNLQEWMAEDKKEGAEQK